MKTGEELRKLLYSIDRKGSRNGSMTAGIKGSPCRII